VKDETENPCLLKRTGIMGYHLEMVMVYTRGLGNRILGGREESLETSFDAALRAEG
jgi:hypothetical protein